MQRGNLIIYDNNGRIWYNSGEAEGDILPHEYPAGLPYIELPFGTMQRKRLVRIDVSDPANPVPTFEELPYQPTYEELQQQLLIAQGII